MSDAENDNLTKEEREIKERAEKEREEAEQAGQLLLIDTTHMCATEMLYLALPYVWTQQLGDVDITIPVPKGTRAKNLNVVIAKKKLSVGLKGQEPILEGELCKEIKVEDSTWTVGRHITTIFSLHPEFTIVFQEDQEKVFIHLEKVNQMTWWENVLTHHPKIDTRKIVPENSKLSDLDGDTRCVYSLSLCRIVPGAEALV